MTMPYRTAPRIDFTADDLAWFRKPLWLALLALVASACTRPPRFPVPEDERLARAARVVVECSDSEPGNKQWSFGGNDFPGDASWEHTEFGSGVLLDGRTAVTAAHVTRCPDLYLVHVFTATGERFLSAVTHTSGGLSYLTPLGAWDSWTDAGKPGIGSVAIGDDLCVGAPHQVRCGEAERLTSREVEIGSAGYLGLSGSGVWEGDRLVGIVQGISARGDAVAQLLR